MTYNAFLPCIWSIISRIPSVCFCVEQYVGDYSVGNGEKRAGTGDFLMEVRQILLAKQYLERADYQKFLIVVQRGGVVIEQFLLF